MIGKLEPGYRADVVMVKGDRLTWPWVAPDVNPLHLLLLRAKALDVDTVLVEGEVVLQAGRPTKFDIDAIGQALAGQLVAQPDREQHRDLVAKLKPHLTHWYAQWDHPSLTPYAAFNSQT